MYFESDSDDSSFDAVSTRGHSPDPGNYDFNVFHGPSTSTELSPVIQISSKNKLVLDFDVATQTELIVVREDLVRQMKDHQKEGVKFMWNCCYESVEEIKKSKGSGCILAHCMGLDKIFQVKVLLHTLFTHPETKTRKVLICCPRSTVHNWNNYTSTSELFKMYYLPHSTQNRVCEIILKEWDIKGGAILINYELFMTLVEDSTAPLWDLLITCGPDLIICDEGHFLRHDSSKLFTLINKVSTSRRIVLTSIPIQNNFIEYHCMVQFVKPDLLGSRTDYLKMFVYPILNGQCRKSKPDDVTTMKERSCILYKTLSGCIQRFDYKALSIYLPEIQEYVLSLKLKLCQNTLCFNYEINISLFDDVHKRGNLRENLVLYVDYHALQRIFSHPYALKLYQTKYENMVKQMRIEEEQENLNDPFDENVITQIELNMFKKSPVSWWRNYVTDDEMEDVRSSVKFHLLFEIIKKCEEIGEKLLVFINNSLYTLEAIEYFLSKINNADEAQPNLCGLMSTWEYELDYFKLTSQTPVRNISRYCTSFNTNPRSRLFLISTRVGGLGLNLTGANRAIILDTSLNPSYDVQSIFSIYRLGQEKPCYVYRLLAYGTMEEAIYKHEIVNKSNLYPVIDEKRVIRRYTSNELERFYTIYLDKPYPLPDHDPKDELLKTLFNSPDKMICFFYKHNSLLEHKE